MTFADLVERFARAAVAGDGDALADLFTPDGTYDDYFFGPCRGRAAIKDMLAHFAEALCVPTPRSADVAFESRSA